MLSKRRSIELRFHEIKTAQVQYTSANSSTLDSTALVTSVASGLRSILLKCCIYTELDQYTGLYQL